MSKYIKCPKCRSINIDVIQDNRNDFNAGVGGWLLTGTLFGAISSAKNQKSVFQCMNCGKVFKKVW